MHASQFHDIATRLRPRILQEARRITSSADDAEDTAQDVLLRLWQMRERLPAVKNVDALALVMARNRAIDLLRRRRPDAPLDEAHGLLSPLPGTDARLLEEEADAAVDAIMAQLTPAQRAVITMRHVEGMEISEIAQIIQTSENNTRVLLHRARTRVRQIFSQHPPL